MTSETIKFEIDFTSEFWDLPPLVEISIDNEIKWQGALDQKKYCVAFFSDLMFGQNHHMKIKRSGKNEDQCKLNEDGSRLDQYAIIDRVRIDDLDIENLIWSRSWYEPEYPVLWKQQQEQQGIVLKKQVIGETWLSHNGTWNFIFSSPFYKFVISQFEV